MTLEPRYVGTCDVCGIRTSVGASSEGTALAVLQDRGWTVRYLMLQGGRRLDVCVNCRHKTSADVLREVAEREG